MDKYLVCRVVREYNQVLTIFNCKDKQDAESTFSKFLFEELKEVYYEDNKEQIDKRHSSFLEENKDKFCAPIWRKKCHFKFYFIVEYKDNPEFNIERDYLDSFPEI